MSTALPVVVVGAGAAGLHCAAEAGLRGAAVTVLERGRKAGRKILISGGGRCNFTNVENDPRRHYLSSNPHFCLSALRRYPPESFLTLIRNAGIPYHEKKLGQLFCDGTADAVVAMLLGRCEQAGVDIRYGCEVTGLTAEPDGGWRLTFTEEGRAGELRAERVVVATGGLSIPNLSTDFAFRSARNLGIEVTPLRAGLVPFTWNNSDRELLASLSGVSVAATAAAGGAEFAEDLLFTHRGLSGPVILQISSYWHEGERVLINLLPELDLAAEVAAARSREPRLRLSSLLTRHLPARLVETVSGHWFTDGQVAQLPAAQAAAAADHFNRWAFMPGGTEGYRTAEVTLGGIQPDALSSRTMESRAHPGLYFIGEAVDVTGHLGGHNFQWAWASAHAAALAIAGE